MAGPIDHGCDREQLDRDRAIEAARKPTGPKAIGHCLWCNTELGQGYRWCDSECREDWDLAQESAKRHRGRA